MPTYSLHKIHQRHQFGFDPDDFRKPKAFIEQLYEGAIGNGYHTIDAYRGNLAYIKEHIQSTTYGYK